MEWIRRRALAGQELHPTGLPTDIGRATEGTHTHLFLHFRMSYCLHHVHSLFPRGRGEFLKGRGDLLRYNQGLAMANR